ncbi:hypothetical protein DYD21_01165 [Rhodohalobacter sp. SW132]|uniref:hypothetical protein n=1 Tax=Rhodohalobacter sp. SW132 TaxID=2293433 RepID=UPI000E231AFA|nr:hypothetical protein [Rhodohalobacter sp. SW132]REL38589.1 hypothetical protein DYD21_01165 [Rhodohalobacter sp. SW132]
MIPKPSIWMIRISMIWLLVSAMAGGLILTHKAADLHPALWSLLPVHYELAIWGWLVQFVIGTAYWIFPKKLEGERRGPVLPAWVMVFLFNIGLIFLVLSSFSPNISANALIGRSLLAISILIFAGLIWQRVVSYRNR